MDEYTTTPNGDLTWTCGKDQSLECRGPIGGGGYGTSNHIHLRIMALEIMRFPRYGAVGTSNTVLVWSRKPKPKLLRQQNGDVGGSSGTEHASRTRIRDHYIRATIASILIEVQ